MDYSFSLNYFIEYFLTHIAYSVFIFFLIIGLIYLLIILWKKLNQNEVLKYEFITIIAHKFRTPLTYVKWNTGELITSEQDSYKKQVLTDIQKANEKLIKLTGTLIELTDSDNTSKKTYAFEKILVSSFVRNMCESYKDQFHGKNIFFSVKIPDQDRFIKIDSSRMEFVLDALLENALIYSSPGKNVDVVVTYKFRKVEISVKDNGIGIHKEDFPNLFTKFFRAENARRFDTEGFGIGLYLSKTITRRHKGSLDASSDGEGRGSTFTITLPTVK